MSKIPALCLLALAGAGISGCTVGPDYHKPNTALPAAFVAASTRPSTRRATVATAPAVDIRRWWRTFNDAELNQLVQRAVANNFDLEIALTRLQEARTEEIVIAGMALPTADASGAAARGSGTNSTKSRIGGPLNAASNTTGLQEITQVVGFDAGWELDLFGKYRRELEAARYDTQAAAELRNDVLITVVSDVARAYMDMRGLQLRLAILRENIRTEQELVSFVEQRFNRGLTNELDLALARRELASIQAQEAPLRAQIGAAQRRIAVLLGLYPQDLAAELQHPGVLADPPQRIQPGLPLDLLRRRPDIQEAERELAAATARVGVATAQLFPTVAITAGLGLQGQGLGRTPQTNKFIWSAGPMAEWPLLDFGALDAQIDIQDLQTHEQLVNYKKTIMDAVEEVDDAIDSYTAQQNRLASLSEALVASKRAVELASQRYERGLTDFLNVVDAERQFYELQDQDAVAQETAVLQFIAVYKGLGGGWEDYQTIPPIRKVQPAIVATFQRLAAPEDPEK